jgi:hypothetical protein
MQLTSFTVNFLLLVFGVVIGVYLPLALFYLVSFFRREHLGFILIWRAAVRLAVIVLLFLLIFAAMGFTQQFLGLKETDDVAFMFLGLGVIGGFLVGIILFVIGLFRGRRRTAAGAAA